MGLITFLRRLAGGDAVDRSVEERFKRQLNGADAKNAELDKLQGELDEVLATVTVRQKQISVDSLPSGASGEHRLDLPKGDEHRGERPRTDGAAGER